MDRYASFATEKGIPLENRIIVQKVASLLISQSHANYIK